MSDPIGARVAGTGWRPRLAVVVLSLASLHALGETPGLASQMRALGTRFALLIQSQAIDEAPIWSPDGRHLAIHIEEKWSMIDVDSIVLRQGTWQDRKIIAVAYPAPALRVFSQSESQKWHETKRFDPRRLTTKTGIAIELAPEDLGTAFRVTRKGSEPETLWKTSLETCHSLALSPDETLAAFLCEKNGLVVFAVPP
jgi:hypothetical protein